MKRLSLLPCAVVLVSALSITARAHAAEAPADFIDDARALMREVACTGNAPLPEGADAKLVEEHCKKITPRMEAYREKYVKGAQAFFAKILPGDAPKTVVYPFGGGDLVTALTVFPAATEYTTISLEHAGDVRKARSFDKKKFAGSLSALTDMLGKLLEVEDFSRSLELSNIQQKELPGEMSFFMTALAVHGYEPTSVKYFRIEDDGSLHYFSNDEIAQMGKKRAKRLKSSWADPNFSEAFSNVEITFKRPGEPDSAAKIHRHIAGNLHDSVFGAKVAPLRAHLEKKGHVSGIVKAASYLLWQPGFSSVRDWLATNASPIVSESSGIPPRYAKKAGLEQETYGEFTKAYLPDASEEISKEMAAMWKSQPQRELPFRFGYPDAKLKNHLMVTKRAEQAKK